MSMPKIEKSENPIDREQSINNLIESVALMETGLSHVINAEGEKIQKVVKHGEDTEVPIEDILRVNESSEKMINSISKLEMILQSKLETSKCLDEPSIVPGPPGPPGPPGKTETVMSLSASHIGSITIPSTVGGEAIPLPVINYKNGFKNNDTNTVFIVENSGVYLITYLINVFPYGGVIFEYELAIRMNGEINDNSSVRFRGQSDEKNIVNSIILNLDAGTAFELVIKPLVMPSMDVTLKDGVSASLVMVKIA